MDPLLESRALASFLRPSTDVTRPTLRGTFGMAASTHWVASAVAQSVLERGGNAFDASVAAGFVLHIVEPHLNGPGGDMVAMLAPSNAPVEVVVGQGPAPLRATVSHYRAEGFDTVPGAGALAAAVPGAVEAWLWILKAHGTWDIANILEYALHYAEIGQPISPQLADTFAGLADHFRKEWPSSARIWLTDGKAPAAGQVVGNPVYAQTLRRLLDCAGSGSRERRIDEVVKEWKHGFVAKAIADFVLTPHWHSDERNHAGVITLEDFASFAVTTEPPLTLRFRGYTVAKASFWTQSPVLLQALAILDHFADRDLDPSSTTGAHTIIEAVKLAMADRDAYYGDGADREVVQKLLEPRYTAQRAELIGQVASSEFAPGSIAGTSPYIPPLSEAKDLAGRVTGEPTARQSDSAVPRGDTVHLDVVDKWGNLVSATPSGGWLQSSPAIPELGFCLGTRLQMTWLDERSPSALVPGKRPRTTLSPTILLREGVAISALGTPGGDQQDQWQLLYLLRTIIGGYTPQQAIDSPMFHTTAVVQSFWPRQWSPRGVVVEDRLGVGVIDGLRDRGHEVAVSGPWSLGRLSAVTRDAGTGVLSAAANSRGAQGYATGR
jgi:gamma-glutamyltranspeptidase / glutathione hydrolase